MSTQIQQQQVQGLVAAVSGVTANSGNLVMTGAALLADIAATGYVLDTDLDTVSGLLTATGSALSGAIVNNTNNLLTTGNTLSIDISGVAANLVTSGATLTTNLIATGAALSGNLITTGATLTTNLIATGGALSGNLVATGADISGNLVATGAALADRLGQNSQIASNLGATTDSSTQLHGEVLMSSTGTCANRVLQWVGDVPPGTTSGLYLGGLSHNNAEIPVNSQWFVKMYCNAKSIEPLDRRSQGHIGICGLETGFIADHEGGAGSSIELSGINGVSGVTASGAHYEFQIGTSGTPGSAGYLVMSGANTYTGRVRFHATAYVSQMLH